jgi:excisionase family DNA binding protein
VPIWLTEFHPVAKNNLDSAGVEIASAQPASVLIEAVEPTKNNATQVSQPKPVARAENVVAPTKSAPEFFTSIKAAAEYAQISERTIKNWKRDGWLKVEQVGKKIRIAKKDLEKCIKKQ